MTEYQVEKADQTIHWGAIVTMQLWPLPAIKSGVLTINIHTKTPLGFLRNRDLLQNRLLCGTLTLTTGKCESHSWLLAAWAINSPWCALKVMITWLVSFASLTALHNQENALTCILLTHSYHRVKFRRSVKAQGTL